MTQPIDEELEQIKHHIRTGLKTWEQDHAIEQLAGWIRSVYQQRDAARAQLAELEAERDSAIAHRDDYETVYIEQGIKLRTARAQLTERDALLRELRRALKQLDDEGCWGPSVVPDLLQRMEAALNV